MELVWLGRIFIGLNQPGREPLRSYKDPGPPVNIQELRNMGKRMHGLSLMPSLGEKKNLKSNELSICDKDLVKE